MTGPRVLPALGNRPTPLPTAPAPDAEPALARPWWRLRFAPGPERAYQESTALLRVRRSTACGLVGMVSILHLTTEDATTIPEVAWLLEPFRWVIVVLGSAVVVRGAAALRWARRPPARALEIGTAGVLVLVSAYIVVAARHADDAAEHTLIGALLLLIMYNGIVARQPFGLATAVATGALLAYALVGEPADQVGRLVFHGHLLLFGTGVAFTLLGIFLLESRERRAHVLHVLDAQRQVALAHSAEALRHQALRDPLTGLANRRQLDAELHRAWAGPTVAVLALDVDHFKAYNDHYGHPAGDACLQHLGNALARVAAAHGGTAARVGGEEFSLLLPDADEVRAAGVADQVVREVRALALPHAGSAVGRVVTVSVGVAAVRPRDGAAAGQLLAAADAALYRAKAGGRDRWAVADGVPAAAAPAAVTDPPTVPVISPEDQEVERIQALLTRRRLRLRFPADLEADLWGRRAPSSGWGPALLSLGGLAYCLLYMALGRPLVADVGGRALGGIACLVAVLSTAVVIRQLLRPGWRAAFRATAVAGTVYSLGFLWLVSASGSPALYSFALGVFLVPMFLGVVAQIPFGHTLVLSLLVAGGYVVLLRPADADAAPAYAVGVTIMVNATLYSLVACWLLERAARREHLLTRLQTAQLGALVRNTEDLHRLATRDPLTGLTNRRGFEDEFTRACTGCRDAGRPLSLLIIDVDHFKRYNDGHGHPAGDECLRRIGAALTAWARTAPTLPGPGQLPVGVARLGGEEFGVLLPGQDPATAAELAEEVRLVVRGLGIEHGSSPVAHHVTVSVGVATALPGAADDRALLADADAALYRAKNGGRDRTSA